MAETGNRFTQNVRYLKKGDILFEENSDGRELYIIQQGKVGVYKNSPHGRIELATIEKNGVVGEMSLLDDQPRSATVIAGEDSSVVVINKAIFNQTLQQIPSWLSSIIKIVISRLRETNSRIGESMLQHKEHGFVSLLLLLSKVIQSDKNGALTLDYKYLLTESNHVSRLSAKEVNFSLSQLENRKIIRIEEPQGKGKMIVIDDPQVLKLYCEYLELKRDNRNFLEADISQESVALFSNIAYLAQKSGIETENGTTLSKAVLINDLRDEGLEKIEAHEKNLQELDKIGLIETLPDDQDSIILFKKENLIRIKKINEWLPQFKLEM
ncbi:cyclic nucleotide-binding domain-containing protein [Chitinispirillales bacterium ANBcel5]|uniref:Crp/Fnr family transcriptional regulator n=1 Tax=Cellulosispirillum alkaliphilum TaxID=3039283 RepID=UPI002A52ABAE|nr:cyclic nucleotide-binding domain-containing protein [Chitinispirillales bacterium ANBcel5]